MSEPVLVVSDIAPDTLTQLLDRYGLTLVILDDDASITGSFWGDSEAGIVGRQVFVRRDTPIHSLLHEVLSLIHISEPTRLDLASRMPSSA